MLQIRSSKWLAGGGALFFFLSSVLSVMWAYNHDFQSPLNIEFSHYADIARSIIYTGSYTSHFVEPMELAGLDARDLGEPPWPVTYRFPFYAVLLAISFLVMGPSDFTVILTNGVIWAGFVTAVWLIGLRLFHRPVLAFSAALLCMVNPFFFEMFVLSGETDILFALLFLVHCFWLAQILVTRGSLESFFLAGVLGGICYLTRFSFVIFVPAILLAIKLYSERSESLKMVAGYCGGLALPSVPFFVWRLLEIGSLQSSTFYANLAQVGTSLVWHYYTTTLEYNWKLIAGKWLYNFLAQIGLFSTIFRYTLVIPFVWYGIYHCVVFEKSVFLKRFFTLYLWSALIHLIVMSALRVEYSSRYWLWLVPIISFAAVYGIERVVSAVPAKFRQLMVISIVVLCGLWMLGQYLFFFKPVRFAGWEPKPPQELEYLVLDKLIPPQSLLISNVAPHIAWYIKRPAIDLPSNLDEVKKIIARHPVTHLYIVTEWPNNELYKVPFWLDYIKQPQWRQKLGAELKAKKILDIRGTTLFVMSDSRAVNK